MSRESIWDGVDKKRSLFDREFYRASLIADLRKMNLPCLFPTKKYKWVRRQISNFLHLNGNNVIGTLFSQTMQQYPNQKSAFVRMVIIGHNNESAFDIRDKFIRGKLTYREAKKKLAAFYTTLKPWKDKKGWARYLAREYKRRWNIETGFRELNSMHENFRTSYYQVKLSDSYLRSIIYNSWQGWRVLKKREGVHHKHYTFKRYRKKLTHLIEEVIIESILDRY